MLAKIAATLDSVARGRLILGPGLRLARARVSIVRLPVRPPGRPVRGDRDRAPAAARRRARLAGRTWTQLDDAVILPKPPRRDPDRDRVRRPADDVPRGPACRRLAGRLERPAERRVPRRARAARCRLCGRGPNRRSTSSWASRSRAMRPPTTRTCRSTRRDRRRPRGLASRGRRPRPARRPPRHDDVEIALDGSPLVAAAVSAAAQAPCRLDRTCAAARGIENPGRLTTRVSWLLALVPRIFVRSACREEC